MDVLSSVDHLFLLETYLRGRASKGAGGKDLFNQLKLKTSVSVEFVESIQRIPSMLESRIRPGDLVVIRTERLLRSENLTQRWQRLVLDEFS